MQRPPSRPHPLPRPQPRATPRKPCRGAAPRAAKAPACAWRVCRVRDKRGCNLRSTLSMLGECKLEEAGLPYRTLSVHAEQAARSIAGGLAAECPSPCCCRRWRTAPVACLQSVIIGPEGLPCGCRGVQTHTACSAAWRAAVREHRMCAASHSEVHFLCAYSTCNCCATLHDQQQRVPGAPVLGLPSVSALSARSRASRRGGEGPPVCARRARGVTIEFQRSQAKAMQRYFRELNAQKAAEKAQCAPALHSMSRSGASFKEPGRLCFGGLVRLQDNRDTSDLC